MLQHWLQSNKAYDWSLEAHFLAAWGRIYPDLPLETQYPACKGLYRLLFAYPQLQVAVEFEDDGPGAARRSERDRRRDRELQQSGWKVVRFSTSEIQFDVERCVREAGRLLERLQGAAIAGRRVSPPDDAPGGTVLHVLWSILLKLVVLVMLLIGVLWLLVSVQPYLPAWLPGSATPTPATAGFTAATALPSSDSIAPMASPSSRVVRYMARVTADQLQVRFDPLPTGRIAAMLRRGTIVAVLGEKTLESGEQWVYVRPLDSSLVQGWVKAVYIKRN